MLQPLAPGNKSPERRARGDATTHGAPAARPSAATALGVAGGGPCGRIDAQDSQNPDQRGDPGVHCRPHGRRGARHSLPAVRRQFPDGPYRRGGAVFRNVCSRHFPPGGSRVRTFHRTAGRRLAGVLELHCKTVEPCCPPRQGRRPTCGRTAPKVSSSISGRLKASQSDAFWGVSRETARSSPVNNLAKVFPMLCRMNQLAWRSQFQPPVEFGMHSFFHRGIFFWGSP
jgi:hypothetical protein